MTLELKYFPRYDSFIFVKDAINTPAVFYEMFDDRVEELPEDAMLFSSKGEAIEVIRSMGYFWDENTQFARPIA